MWKSVPIIWENVNQQEPHTNETTSNTCFGFVMTMVYVIYVPVSSSLLYNVQLPYFDLKELMPAQLSHAAVESFRGK